MHCAGVRQDGRDAGGGAARGARRAPPAVRSRRGNDDRRARAARPLAARRHVSPKRTFTHSSLAGLFCFTRHPKSETSLQILATITLVALSSPEPVVHSPIALTSEQYSAAALLLLLQYFTVLCTVRILICVDARRIGTAEKRQMELTLRASAPPAHGSMQLTENANTILAKALRRFLSLSLTLFYSF